MCNLCNCSLSKPVFSKNGFDLVQCLSCGLVYVKNQPPDSELKNIYSFNSGYHKCFQAALSWQTKKQLNSGKRYYGYIKKYKKNGRILDIGCSAGFFLKAAKENGWETYGLEISDDTAEIARKRYRLNVLTGVLNENTFPAGYFDVVSMWDIIEHVSDPMKTMFIVNKILAPHGVVILSTPNIDGLFPRLAYKMSGRMNDWLHPEPPYHLFQFSKKTIARLLKDSGFRLLEIYDKKIPIMYMVRSFKLLSVPFKKLLYYILLIPMAIFGPMIGSGDLIIVIAKKGNYNATH